MRRVLIPAAALAAAGLAAIIMVSDRPAPGDGPERHDPAGALYDREEAEARRRLALAQATFGEGSPEAADASERLVRALVRNGRGWSAETLALARRTVETREALHGPDDAAVAPALVELGDTLAAAGDYDSAVAALERAVALREGTSDSGSGSLANVLDHLGTALATAGRHQEALPVLDRSRRIKESAVGIPPSDLVPTLEAIALAAQRAGLYEQAGSAIRRAADRRRVAGADDPAQVKTLNLLAQQLWFEGQLSESKDVSERAVALAERTLRPTHPWLPQSIRYLAATLADLGDLERSGDLRERALGIARQEFGESHHETASYLNSAAMADLDAGDYPGARRRFAQALTAFESRYGPWHDFVATARLNLALVAAHLGDYESARREHRSATAIWERTLGRDHPFVAVALTELAAVYREQGRTSEALPLLERALSIRERSLGAAHRDTGRTLMDLAAVMMQRNDARRARTLAARALRVWERLDLADAPEYATVLAMSAEVQNRVGDYRTARRQYERALQIRARAFGASSPLYADTQSGLSLTLANLGDRPGALRAAAEAEAIGRDHLQLVLRSLPERQALNYAAVRPRGWHMMVTLADRVPDAIPAAFDALVRSRALVLDEIAARHRTAHVSGPVQPAQAAWRSAQQRLANLLARGPGPMSTAEYARVVDGARRERERAEETLADVSAEFRAGRLRDRIGIEEVKGALPGDSVLVSYARYDRPALGRPDVHHYVAFVTSRDRSLAAVLLGPAETVDTQVARWRADLAVDALTAAATTAESRVPSARISGESLRRLIWDPLTPHLAEARRIFVVPDGALGLVPFAALPAGPNGYVLEGGQVIHYLSAERDLIGSPRGAVAERGLLAIGGPWFGTVSESGGVGPGSEAEPPTASAGSNVEDTNCRGLRDIAFTPLPGTVQEVQDISGLWAAGDDARSRSTRLLLGRDATETAVKSDAALHRVLHLATHGFFLSDACSAPAATGTRGVGGLSGARPAPAENPLLLSGLALAGANHRSSAGPDEDDGILTAEEVASLDLGGVEWAVLSACDTGVGEIKAGEGVFGLRRAFQVAGARTVIMSLWSVDDQATRAWMRALYDGRFERRLSTADAVHQASVAVLRERRARGLSTNPFYWAAFVAAGDWR